MTQCGRSLTSNLCASESPLTRNKRPVDQRDDSLDHVKKLQHAHCSTDVWLLPLRRLALIVAVLTCAQASALTCGETSTDKNFDRATFVFLAWVTSVEVPGSSHPDQVKKRYLSLDEYLVARFEVIEVFKGSPSDINFVYSSMQHVLLREGTKYLFFAEEDGFLHLCYGTSWLREVDSSDPRFLKYVDKLRGL